MSTWQENAFLALIILSSMLVGASITLLFVQ